MEERASYSLTAIPDADGDIRRFRVHKQGIFLATVAGLYIVGAVLAAAVHYAFLRSNYIAAQQVSQENAKLRSEVAALTDQVDAVEQQLKDTKKFEDKLRAMTALNDDTRGIAVSIPTEAATGGLDSIVEDKTQQALVSVQLQARFEDLLGLADSQTRLLTLVTDELLSDTALVYGVPRRWPAEGWVTSRFGPRADPTTQEKAMHLGIDVAAASGTEVRNPIDGRVLFVGSRPKLGNVVVIDHHRDIVTHYGHLKDTYVSAGDWVVTGQKIGAVGNTGRSTGPHLHYEIRVAGIPVDPLSLLASR